MPSSTPETRLPAGDRPPQRLAALDGLRGIAALIVVFSHLLLASAAVANSEGAPVLWSAQWWIQLTPLKLFTHGSGAVLVFFVLSGIVIVLPVLRNRDFDWVAYFPRRVLRLYLPVVASVLFAAVLILIRPQTQTPGASDWVNRFSVAEVDVRLVVEHLDIFATVNLLNNPLWTLRWEMLFSLALPIFVVIAVRTARHWVLWGLACAAAVWIGYELNFVYLVYLPVFLVGAVIAVHAEALFAWAARVGNSRRADLAFTGALAAGIALLLSFQLVGTVVPQTVETNATANVLGVAGATVIVLVCMLWRGAKRLLTIAPARWLGRVSFSLYLVHVPILIAVANVLGPGRWPATVAIALAASLVVAELFYRGIEGPAHRFSKRAGASASAALRGGRGVPERPPVSRQPLV